MSLIPIAAELIRRAAVDETYAQDLVDGVRADPTAFDGLVYTEVPREDLRWLSPSECLWFAGWRQGMGGPLDWEVLAYLESSALPRAARFQMRGLAMRDPEAERLAWDAPVGAWRESVGLRWLQQHAQRVEDDVELAYDACQYATEAAWFTLRVLTSRSEPVTVALQRFVEERQLSDEITGRWWG